MPRVLVASARRTRKTKSPPAVAEGLGYSALASRVGTRVNPSGQTSCGWAGAFASDGRTKGSSLFSHTSLRGGADARCSAADATGGLLGAHREAAARVRAPRLCRPYCRRGSRHPLDLPPALERGPDVAVEPEAVDRDRARQGADAAQAGAGPLEAALLEDAARARIGDARARRQRLVVEVGEGIVDDGAHCLGGVALAPMWDAEPVAELGRLPLDEREAAGTHDRAVGERNQKRDLAARPVDLVDEILRVGKPVRKR